MIRLVAAILLALLVYAAPAQAAPRVAALTPFSASTITRLGVRPVVVGQTLGGTDQYLASLRNVPVIPLSHPLGPNMEQLATYNASIVLSSKTWQRGTPAMRRLGMKVYESDPSSIAAVGHETRAIGKILGRTRAANALATKIENDVRAAQQGIKRRPRVLVILGVGRTPYAMLANSWGGDVVAKAGGQLLTQGLRAPSGIARISDEIVVQRNPDIIIAVPHGNPGAINRLAQYYRSNPNWRNTRAVKNNRVYVATGNQLLQPYPGVAATIRSVRAKFLKNY
ncbi:ABC transporter substrate-binding protein [Solirubrobacter sp. CPCC 204708]|uniref:ABC transporter substrate-binding protein n=1 Tax=Solirubrobacter deserti TaxID=2282478 RepID=A0ABT4RBI0_9ACTN|nr:ABC transporter substrate-binding protein [Solirubrobacter deserti]MBE2317224.1 ABC transporter substrate-binding protein [Solirubrobacter deserti]MDA0135883.1 ABC transporter substrate-binding protein [Solirubrobacter deserti]